MRNDCIDHAHKNTCRGYAKKQIDGKWQQLHRLAYCKAKAISIDEIKGLVIRHECDNPRCVNPDHLLIGTSADNNRDTAVRLRHGRRKLTDEQIQEIRKNCRPSMRGERANPNSYTALAKRFGVATEAIRAVYLGRTFTHLPESV